MDKIGGAMMFPDSKRSVLVLATSTTVEGPDIEMSNLGGPSWKRPYIGKLAVPHQWLCERL